MSEDKALSEQMTHVITVPVLKPYNPPPVPAGTYRDSIGGSRLPIHPLELITPQQAQAVKIMLQPFYASVIKIGYQTGIFPSLIHYDPSDQRRIHYGYSDDGTIVNLALVTYWNSMVWHGVGLGGKFVPFEVIEAGGIHPGRDFGSRVVWQADGVPVPGMPAKPFVPAKMVVVTGEQIKGLL